MANSLLSVLLLFFVFPFTCSSPPTFLCHALLQFKSAFSVDIFAPMICGLNGDPSYPKTESWKEGTDCCSSWDGVTCDEVTGHVIELDLSCSQLVGTFHSNTSLFSSHIAPYLHRLNLAFNDFQGSNMSSGFGVEFGSSLTHLNLSYSGFGGNIPSEISHLSNLVSLDLLGNESLRIESNRVMEKIAQNLTHLRVLHLFHVDMSSLVHSLMNLSSSLTYLDLYDCQLQGQFPTSLLLRPNLQVLDARSNKFSPITTLPDLNSTNLTILYLDDIDLSLVSNGFLDFIGNLKSLRVLDLANCHLRGPIPSSFCDRTHLRYLELGDNELNGPVPSWFCNMTHLSYLDLGDNELNGSFPSCLLAMPSLETLDLSGNKLYGQIPNSLSQTVNLTTLDLSNNSNLSSSTSASALANVSYFLPRFDYLNLSSCNLTQFPTFLKALSNLTVLDLSNNKIQGPLPEWMFDDWKNIEFLDFHSNLIHRLLPVPLVTTIVYSVSKNSFSGEISSSICTASSLTAFDLWHNQFVGLIPPCLGNLSYLSVLNLGMNHLHGTIPNTFVKDNNLNYLILNENQLRGRLPHTLSYCQNLKVLHVGNNMIEDVFPHWLEILSTLQVLVLRSNKFFGRIDGLKSRIFFPRLRILDVSNNSLSGPLPTQLISNLEAMVHAQEGLGQVDRYTEASLYVRTGSTYYSMIITAKGVTREYEKIQTALTVVDFSENRFEGDIPRVIGKLGSLIGLNLSHNLLTRHIPPSMGGLVSVEWLDLSSNKLDGQIPAQLTELTFLEVLNLSHNQLDGPIPQGKQFNTFGNDSYKGNSGLCGFPLSKACGTSKEAPSQKNGASSLDSGSGFSWEGTYVGYGCGVVFGLLVGYLVFSSGWPKWFVRMVQGKQRRGRTAKRSKKREEEQIRTFVSLILCYGI